MSSPDSSADFSFYYGPDMSNPRHGASHSDGEGRGGWALQEVDETELDNVTASTTTLPNVPDTITNDEERAYESESPYVPRRVKHAQKPLTGKADKAASSNAESKTSLGGEEKIRNPYPALSIPTASVGSNAVIRYFFRLDYPMGPILSRTFMLWFIPIVMVGLWLSIPLSGDPTSDSREASLTAFLAFRGTYTAFTIWLVIKAFEIVMPVPKNKGIQVLLCMLFGGIDIATHYVILSYTNVFSVFLEVTLTALSAAEYVIFQAAYCYHVGWFRRAQVKAYSSSNSDSPVSVDDDGGSSPLGLQFDSGSTTNIDHRKRGDLDDGWRDDHLEKYGPSKHDRHESSHTDSELGREYSFAEGTGYILARDPTEQRPLTANPILLFIGMAAVITGILAMFAYCALFTYVFTQVTEGRPDLQLILSFTFGFPLLLLGNLIRVAADWLDDHSGSGKCLGPSITFLEELMHQVFYKNLFISVSNFGIVALLLTANLVQQFLAYPVRMTRTFHRWKNRVVERTQHSKMRFLLYIAIGEDCVDDIEDYRNEVDVDFYYLCMAQRIALTAFVAYLPVLRFFYNKPFYTYSDTDITDDNYSQLLWFAVIMLFVEWGGSTIIHVIILIWFKRDTIKLGSVSMIRCSSFALTIAIAVHVLCDIYFVLNRVDL